MWEYEAQKTNITTFDELCNNCNVRKCHVQM